MADSESGVRMSLFEHLAELRRRLLVCAMTVLAAAAATFSFSSDILRWLTEPLGAELVFLSPTEAFWVSFKVSLIVGLLIALPVVLYQGWRFVAPGLYRTERRYAAAFVIGSCLFFALGLVFCAFVALPFALKFLIAFGVERGMKPMISAQMYVDFALKMYLAFGLIFEVPLAVTLAGRMGVVTPAFLARNRRYALLVNAVLAAVLTPTSDLFNMAIMLVPLTVLYEIGILGVRIFGQRRPAPETATASS
ncbi:MAG: twin-arginine translocase subunit TatC [Nitrospirota bacterium]